LPQLRQRAPADDLQHLVVAPLALRAGRTKLAFDQLSALDEALQRGRDDGDAEAVAVRDVVRRERTVRARIAQHEIADRIGDRLQIALRESGRKRRAEGVAVARRVLDGDEALLARDLHFEDAPLLEQVLHVDGRACRDLVRAQIAEAEQEVVDRIGGARLVALVEVLQLELRLLEGLGIEQLAQLRLAEELAQLRLIDRQRLSAALRERRIAVVQEIRG